MRIALAQLNPTVGDIRGNTRLILEAIETARREGAHALVTSEMAVIGYPPRDLIQREGVVERCERAVEEIAAAAGEMTVFVGHPRRAAGGVVGLRNSVSICRGGRVETAYDKRLLPTYDVFDEDRYFSPGASPCVVNVGGLRLGVLICEDLWRADDVSAERRYTVDPVQETIALDCDAIIVPSASPFIVGKNLRHINQLAALAKKHKMPIVSVNQVGGNDDLIFPGGSVVIDDVGSLHMQVGAWKSSVSVMDLESAISGNATSSAARKDRVGLGAFHEELFDPLVLGIRDYVRKTGHQKVIVGLSGGIDSALVATLAVAALGPENVRGITMPSRYSSRGSVEDSATLARNLKLAEFDTISIESAHAALTATVADLPDVAHCSAADENAQARLRGLLLMSIANATGALVLATGNKSEMAVGYCTLYGDMCGAIAVLGDVTKTRVWELARWINVFHKTCGFDRPPIPQSSIDKVPSAELRPNQTDQDTLPPYEILDQIIERYVDLEQSVDRIITETKIDAALVSRWTRIIDQNEYKREQAAVVLKVTECAFGRGRRYPMAFNDGMR